MGLTTNLQEQHKRLLEMATEISNMIKNEELSKDANVLTKKLATFSGKIGVHLAIEDKALYPRLLKNSNEDIRRLTQKYIDEMGNIKAKVGNYIQKWRSPVSIQDNPPEFIKESEGIFKALAHRIERENTELYPLVDAKQ